MSISDENRPGTSPGGLHRNRIAVGAAAAAMVLGSGAYLITTQVRDRTDRGDTGDASGPVQVAPSATSVASPSPAPSMPVVLPTTERKATPKSARTSVAADPAEVRKQITAAREKAARDGFPLQRALTASAGPIHDAGSYVEESRSLPGGGTMRIMSARYDLSGQHEMLWAADNGHQVGDVRCTQNFHFSPTAKGAVRPTMLLCWRTSNDRSVVVLTVAKHPSTTSSTEIIDDHWAKLG